MNIFVLDKDIAQSVRYHIDAHVSKMPLEAAQMISTTIAVSASLGFVPRPLTKEEIKIVNVQGSCIYKPCYHNHPCTIWARSSLENYQYLVSYCKLLGQEKLHRYPAKPAHKSALLVAEKAPDTLNNFSSLGLTPFAMAMPEEYKCDNAIEAYRTYYYCEKQYNVAGRPMSKWTNRQQPEWWL